jgi:Fe-S cluster assembly protein SufB
MTDMKSTVEKSIGEYAAGFDPRIESEVIPEKGVSEDVIRRISRKNGEDARVLNFRLAAYKKWLKMKEPHWAMFEYAPIDYGDIYYFAQPRRGAPEADEKIRKTYERLGVPLDEQKLLLGEESGQNVGQAVDAVVDSRSVATTYRDQLAALGIIFCPISAALKEHPDLVWKYLGSVVPATDNFFAALNSAVFSDGTFIYVPKKVKCPIELSSYFRLQAEKLGQFERTLIVADEGSELTYLEGCSAPVRSSYQMHSGVVEVVALPGASVRYATVQNWYGGDEEGNGGIYNFVTKRGIAHDDASISWTQLEVGSIKTWKYPSCILKGDRARGEFYSVAITNRRQAADTGTKMIHLGRDTSSTVFSKGVALGRSQNGYRGLVDVGAGADGAKSYTKCDNLIIGDAASVAAMPDIRDANFRASVAHEASVSSISDEQMFFLESRGIGAEQAVGLIVNGFCSGIIKRLPAEFALEARELINISIEG